jgi:hypothetical protein
VLDEATSNIAAESQKAIQDALNRLVKGRTTIAIAHRLSTLRNADRILVFDLGRLVEEGSHAELFQKDGVYARLVRIQTQVSKDPNVDRLLMRMDSLASAPEVDGERSLRAQAAAVSEPAFGNEDGDNPSQTGGLTWLAPRQHEFRLDANGQVRMHHNDNGDGGRAVYVVRTFPASHPERYLSVRSWNENGDDAEVGLLRDLCEWPAASQASVRASLGRRYLLRRITRVYDADLIGGYLELDVETDAGRSRFVMRWTQSQAIDFAENGKMLIDTDDNRYIVDDVDELPKRDRERFLRFVYW